MKCPKCNSECSSTLNRCNQCGQPLHVTKKILACSGAMYNRGLERATERDLTGAIKCLQISLKYNKENTDARNLLGLVYYEMGETVEALSQWVISKHFQNEDNRADRYMEEVQADPTRLEMINQTIKKYNSSLISAKQDNDDLAIIQLKKVTSLNPNFVRAHQLLALLYIRRGEKPNAIRALQNAYAIDSKNETTLRYIKEVDPTGHKFGHAVPHEAPREPQEPTREPRVYHPETSPNVKKVGNYKEEKPKILPFINVVIGIIIGIVFAVVLIFPTMNKGDEENKQSEIINYGDQLAEKNSKISSLENEVKNLTNQIDDLNRQLNDTEDEDPVENVSGYEKLFEAINYYLEEETEKVAIALADVDANDLELEEAKSILAFLKSEAFGVDSQALFEKGRDTYNNGKYDEALEFLEQALELDERNVDALYFMGRVNQRKGETELAAEYFNRVINEFGDSSRARESRTRLGEMNMTPNEDGTTTE